MIPRAKVKRVGFSHLLSTALVAVLMCVVGFTGVANAGKTAKEIDASVDAAMDRFYKMVENAAEVVDNAKGLVIMPNVKKAGLIVGGEYGKGALKINGQTVDCR